MPFFSSTKDSDEQLAQELSEQVTLLARQDPEFAAMMARGNKRGPTRFLGSLATPDVREYLAQHGIDLPDGFGLRNFSDIAGKGLVQVSAPETMPTSVKLGIGATGALAGGAALGAYGGGGAGASSAASSSAPGAGLFGAPAAGASAAGSGGAGAGLSAAGASGGLGGAIKKFFGSIDPTTAVLGGMSLLGGDEGPQERHSFAGSGRTDPKNALGRAFAGTDDLISMLSERVKGAKPVVIPQLPMQIGGGLGMDPAKRTLPQLGLLTGNQKKSQGY